MNQYKCPLCGFVQTEEQLLNETGFVLNIEKRQLKNNEFKTISHEKKFLKETNIKNVLYRYCTNCGEITEYVKLNQLDKEVIEMEKNLEGFKEVGGTSGEMAPAKKFEKEGDSIMGTYVRKQENVGAFKSNLYIIKTSEGEQAVWGSNALDRKMNMIQTGKQVYIEYLGKKQNPKTKRQFKDWKVLEK